MDNYNSKSVPSARQQIKLIQEKQKLLAIAIQAARLSYWDKDCNRSNSTKYTIAKATD